MTIYSFFFILYLSSVRIVQIKHINFFGSLRCVIEFPQRFIRAHIVNIGYI